MQIEDEAFSKRIPDFKKLIEYGFKRTVGGGKYQLKRRFFNNQFQAVVSVNSEGKVVGTVIDLNTEEEYLPLRAIRPGAFTMKVIEGYTDVLKNIASNCFIKVPFSSPQANRIARWIEQNLGDQPERIFKNLPNYAVFREPSSTKWYGLVMDIPQNRLVGQKALKSREKVEVLEFKIDPKDRARLLKLPGFYHGYHLDKPNWLCVTLDDSQEDNTIINLIRKSHSSVLVKNAWIIPANPKYYDIMGAFNNQNTIIWKQSTKMQIGDIVFIYVTSPVKAIVYQCKVEETDIPYQYNQDGLKMQKVMRIKIIRQYPNDQFTFAFLKHHGIKAIRGPQHVKKELLSILK